MVAAEGQWQGMADAAGAGSEEPWLAVRSTLSFDCSSTVVRLSLVRFNAQATLDGSEGSGSGVTWQA